MDPIFFTGWDSLVRTLIVGVMAYVSLVFLLRVSGNRTLSKMNAFDLIVTVALGSTLANVLLNKEIGLAEGVLAFALLIALQYAVTWSSVRAGWVRQVVTGEPRLLAYRGHYLPAAMRKARITEAEILAAVRSAGMRSLADTEAVVLETDGSVTAVERGESADVSSLKGVVRPRGI